MAFQIRLGVKEQGTRYFADIKDQRNLAGEDGLVRIDADSPVELGYRVGEAIAAETPDPAWEVYVDHNTDGLIGRKKKADFLDSLAGIY